MNTHPREEEINRTKQHPPKRPQRRISIVEEVSHCFIHRGFLQDSFAAFWILFQPLRN